MSAKRNFSFPFHSDEMNANLARKGIRPARAAAFLGALLWGLNAVPAGGLQTSQTTQTTQPQTNERKAKLSVPPEYPELARKMNIQGTARVLLTVAPEGKVVAVKELGGNPVLLAALVQAVRKWRYEAAPRESMIEVRFEFR
jgi:TonB family protein